MNARKRPRSVTVYDLWKEQAESDDSPLSLLPSSPHPWLGLSNGITELSGPGGSGKTQIALSVCLQAAERGLHAVYLCLGGSLPKVLQRLDQMAGTTRRDLLHQILVRPVPHAEDLETLELPERHDLLVVDSIADVYRSQEDSNYAARAKALVQVAAKWKRERPVLVLNQVAGDSLRPALGLVWAHCVDTSYRVNRRRLELVKSPRYNAPQTMDFEIRAEGVIVASEK